MVTSICQDIICTPAQLQLTHHPPCVHTKRMFGASADADAEQPAASSSASSEDAAAAAAPAGESSSSSSTKQARARHISLDDPELNIYLK
jgi:hypothetical protein